MPFAAEDFFQFQVGVIGDRTDSRLQGEDFIVTGHHQHGTVLQTFRKVWCQNGHTILRRGHTLVEYGRLQTRFGDGIAGSVELIRGANEEGKPDRTGSESDGIEAGRQVVAGFNCV